MAICDYIHCRNSLTGGERQRYCSAACRQAAYRLRNGAKSRRVKKTRTSQSLQLSIVRDLIIMGVDGTAQPDQLEDVERRLVNSAKISPIDAHILMIPIRERCTK